MNKKPVFRSNFFPFLTLQKRNTYSQALSLTGSVQIGEF